MAASCSIGRPTATPRHGWAAIGTVSRRTERLVTTYLAGTERLPGAVLFRMRTGSPYREAMLAHDFADVRDLAFPGDTRRLMDRRRSGVVEAIAGGTDVVGLSAKLANSIGRSNALYKTSPRAGRDRGSSQS
jgi:hypothetical protein